MICHRPVRRGGIAVWLLFALPVTIMLVIFAISSCEVSLLVEQSRRTADACAHDAVEALVCDDMLKARLSGRGDYLHATLDRAHDEACRAAKMNLIFGHTILPGRNEDNDPGAEFVFGHVAHHGYGVPFHPVNRHHFCEVNAVRICLERRGRHGIRMPGGMREDLRVTSTAMLDDEVFGFRPAYECSNIPLCPIALDRRVWDESLDDECDRNGLPDIEFKLMAGPDPNPRRGRKPTAVPLTIGTRNIPELCRQVDEGVGSDEYERFVATTGTWFELDEHHHRLAVPGDRYTSAAHARLLAALQVLKHSGQARVWPTTVQFAPHDEHSVWITGFVACRVVRVTEDWCNEDDDDHERNGGGDDEDDGNGHRRVKCIRVVLRPSMMCTPTASTRPTATPNPYICRVRMLIGEESCR